MLDLLKPQRLQVGFNRTIKFPNCALNNWNSVFTITAIKTRYTLFHRSEMAKCGLPSDVTLEEGVTRLNKFFSTQVLQAFDRADL
jgi:hypothetical protein